MTAEPIRLVDFRRNVKFLVHFWDSVRDPQDDGRVGIKILIFPQTPPPTGETTSAPSFRVF